MRKLILLGLFSSTFALAQQPEKGDYSNCDFHVGKSTVCGTFRSDSNGDNNSSFTMREENDTVGLTYLSFECLREGAMSLFLESKNPLMTQTDSDAEIWPRVQFRMDNAALKNLPVSGAQEYDGNGNPTPQLNALQIDEAGLLMQAMASAKTRVQVIIQRNGMSSLTYNFPVYGLEIAMKTVRFCKPMN